MTAEADRKPGQEPDEYLNIAESDPIFSSSYEMLIKETFRDHKHFIIAKIQTRSITAYVQSHSHFFAAYGIMKLIFKKRRDEIVGRFHHEHPISAKNPLTNNVLVLLILNIFSLSLEKQNSSFSEILSFICPSNRDILLKRHYHLKVSSKDTIIINFKG